MSALLESLTQPLPAETRAALLQHGLPGARSEAWKYTSLRALERRQFAHATALPQLDAAATATLQDAILPQRHRLVFINGVFSAAHSNFNNLPEGVALLPVSQALHHANARDYDFLQRQFHADKPADIVFARLNAALAQEGAVLRIDDDVDVAAPIHVVLVSTHTDNDSAWHLRHFIELRRNARAEVIEQQIALTENAHLSNSICHVHLAQGAQLQHYRLQNDAAQATCVLRTDAVLARDARYLRRDVELGAQLSRHECNIRLEGKHAHVDASGVLLANSRRQLDTRLQLTHIAPDTACDLNWRGMADNRAQLTFHGGIEIRAGADGSAAQLQSKNLLLSENAHINTQPVLVIHADEVTAAHGATVGQLDAAALFYLQARGIPQTQARAMLTAAFCHEVLGDTAPTVIKDALNNALTHMVHA